MSRRASYCSYRDTDNRWVPYVPEHWQLLRLKQCVEGPPAYGANLPAEDYADSGVRFLRTSDIKDDGTLTPPEEGVHVETSRVAEYSLQDGDILVSRSGTIGRSLCFRERQGPAAYAGYLVRFRPSESASVPSFLFYWTKSAGYWQQIEVDTIETTIGNFSGQRYANLYLPLPSLDEQRTIAAFLDYETARIDRLIEKQQRLIELLAEKRQAVISHAVTKGLDPNAPMKDSGAEWLGNVPTHWSVLRLKQVSLSIQTGPFGSQIHADDYSEGGTALINPSHIKDGEIIPDQNIAVDEEARNRLSRHSLEQGDLVFARRGMLGRCAVVEKANNGCLCGTGSLRVRLQLARVFPEFVQLYASRSFVAEWLTLESVGSTMDNLNTSLLGNLPTALPPKEEQRQVVSRVYEDVKRLSTLIQRATEMSDLLVEHRTALISAAVSGKIDVRGWQPPPHSADEAEERDDQFLQAAEERATYG